MTHYKQYPDLTEAGLKSIRSAVRLITKGKSKRVDLGNGVIVYKVPSNNPSKYVVRVDMKVEEEGNATSIA